MAQVRCVRAFGALKPGDLAEVPDGAAVDPAHFEPVPPPPAVKTPPVVPVTPPGPGGRDPSEGDVSR